MSVSPFPADRPDLGVPLHLIGPAEALDLSALVVGEPTFERTIDGPSTIVITVADYHRGGKRPILSSGQLLPRHRTTTRERGGVRTSRIRTRTPRG